MAKGDGLGEGEGGGGGGVSDQMRWKCCVKVKSGERDEEEKRGKGRRSLFYTSQRKAENGGKKKGGCVEGRSEPSAVAKLQIVDVALSSPTSVRSLHLHNQWQCALRSKRFYGALLLFVFIVVISVLCLWSMPGSRPLWLGGNSCCTR